MELYLRRNEELSCWDYIDMDSLGNSFRLKNDNKLNNVEKQNASGLLVYGIVF